MHSLKKRTKQIYICFYLIFLFSISCFAKIDDSIDIFFPKSLSFLQYSQTEFPVFWWNFVVINPTENKASFIRANEVCKELQKFQGSEIRRLICSDDLGGYIDTLTEWSHDFVLRQNFNETLSKPAEYQSMLISALTEMSFLSSDKKDFFRLKRNDPLDQWQIYLKKSQSAIPSQALQRQQGFLLDSVSQRIVIPVQFSLEPKMKNIAGVMSILQKWNDVHLIGAHASAYANEKQVHQDMDIVSIVGMLGLAFFILTLVLKGRIGALSLFPPVVVAMGLSAALTDFIFGSIHGLTLAFGSGIVGLAIDYGLHGAFNSDSKQTWKSNSIGFLTTFVGLAILGCSGIPLIRQMMVFASLGIFFGFIIFYFLCKYTPKYIVLKPVTMAFPDFKGNWIIVAFLILYGVIAAFQAEMSFDIRNFNYQLPADAEATNWFFSQGTPQETFMLLHDKSDLYPKAIDEFQWSQTQKISYVGLGDFIPDIKQQKINADSWMQSGCPTLTKKLNPTELKVFAPFFDNICSQNHRPLSFNDLSKKDYLNHLIGHDQFISLLFSKTPEQEKLIRAQFPEAHSMVESIKGFSNSLENDMRWMIPAMFLLCTLVLSLYYKSLFFVIASYIPFLSGLGLFLLANHIRGSSLDLISVLGLLMVFGFSIDYGVFVTDLFAFPKNKIPLTVIYSVLGLAAFTNLVGFFPMVFAKHPILNKLGFALFFGTVGTYLGTRWGLTPFLSLQEKLNKNYKLKIKP